MEHQICTGGCGGSSDQPGTVCQTRDCLKQGQPMEKCECADGQHGASSGEAAESQMPSDEGVSQESSSSEAPAEDSKPESN